MKKQKKKPWSELQENKCPRCGGGLMKDMFGQGLLGCACSFDIKEQTKDLLVNRENELMRELANKIDNGTTTVYVQKVFKGDEDITDKFFGIDNTKTNEL